MYFFYNLHPLFHLKVPKIPFFNSRLFPHADDPLLQETLSELTERRLGADIGGHVELHPPVRGAVIAGLSCGRGARRGGGPESGLAPLTECCGRVWWCTPPCPGSLRLPHINILPFGNTPIISSLFFTFIFFHPHNFNFFIQTQNFKNTRISIEIFKILRI